MFKSIRLSLLLVMIVLSSCTKYPVETSFNGVSSKQLSYVAKNSNKNPVGSIVAGLLLAALVLNVLKEDEPCTPNKVVPVVGGGWAMLLGNC